MKVCLFGYRQCLHRVYECTDHKENLGEMYAEHGYIESTYHQVCIYNIVHHTSAVLSDTFFLQSCVWLDDLFSII